MVRVFQAFAKEARIRALVDGLDLQSSRDHTPRPGDPDYLPKNDVPWIRRFSAIGGTVVISGDTKMQSVPHERLALVQAGMIVIFFERKWNELPFCTKCAILLHWWPEVVKTARTAPSPSFWRIPSTLASAGTLTQLPHGDATQLKIERQMADRKKKVAIRKAKKRLALPGQSIMDLTVKRPAGK